MNNVNGLDHQHQYTAACLFAGMGGFCSAVKNAGVKTLWANDIESNACLTLGRNFEDVRILEGSVENIFVEKDGLEPVDILTAGFPCQSFSQAGHRKGFSDYRGELFFEIVRLVKEFGADRPRFIVLENVPHLLYGDGGKWMDIIVSEVQRLGYWFNSTSVMVLNTAELTAIPQKRERLFMIAMSTDAFKMNNFTFPIGKGTIRPLDEYVDRTKRGPAGTYLPPDNRYYKMILEASQGKSINTILQLRKYLVRTYEGLCPTLTANMGAGGHNVPFVKDEWGIRKLTVEECMRLQGFDTNKFVFPDEVPNHSRYTQVGNTVTVPVAQALIERCVEILDNTEKGTKDCV
jgi:DNA (cytosine-5)-methyltransferase 1